MLVGSDLSSSPLVGGGGGRGTEQAMGERQSGRLPSTEPTIRKNGNHSEEELHRRMMKLTEDVETLRFYLPRWIYVLFVGLSLLAVWAILGVLIYAVVDGGNASDQIDVVFEALDEFGLILEMILENTMVPPPEMIVVSRSESDRKRTAAGLNKQTRQQDWQKHTVALQLVREKMQSYLRKNGKRPALTQVQMQTEQVRKRQERSGIGAKPGGIDMVTDLYNKAGYESTGHKTDNGNAQLYEQYKQGGKHADDDEVSQSLSLGSSSETVTVNEAPMVMVEEGNGSVSPPGVLPGGIGRAFADYYSDYKSRVFCQEEDNYPPDFQSGDEENLEYFGNVSMACAVRHLAQQVDYIVYVMNMP